MPEVNTPTVPKPAAAAAAPAPAPSTTPAAVTPAAPRNDKGQFTKPKVSAASPRRQTVSAKKVLGEDPFKSAEAVVKAAREKIAEQTKTFTPNVPEPEPVEEVIEEPVTPPADSDVPVVAAPETPATSTPAPAAEPKIKFHGKEYTQAELDAHFAEIEAKANQPAPAIAPAPEPPKPPTAEEIAKQNAELAQREAQFVQDLSGQLDAPLTEQEFDVLLAGGKPAVELMTSLRKRDMATAVLQARKGIATALNPVIDKVFQTLNPLVGQWEQLQRHNVESQFLTKHKDFVPHLDRARSVADELYKRYPNEVNKMSPEQFIDEVARQTDIILTNEYKRWNPSANTSWREAARAAQAPPAPPAAAPVIPAPAIPPTPAAPKVRPPATNAPAGFPAPGAGGNWQKGVASSLRG